MKKVNTLSTFMTVREWERFSHLFYSMKELGFIDDFKIAEGFSKNTVEVIIYKGGKKKC